MNNKLTSKRFNEHMSYDWLKYIIIIALVIVFWVILFSIGGAKLKTSEVFEICIVSKYNYSAEFSKIEDQVLSNTSNIKEASITHFFHGEKNIEDYLRARMQGKQGDLFILDNTPVEYDENGQIKKDEYGNMISEKNFFLHYVDLGLFKPLDEFIEEGIALEYEDVEADVEAYLSTHNSYKSEQSKQKFRDEYKERIVLIRQECAKLKAFLNEHEELVVRYKKGTQMQIFYPEQASVVEEEEKAWGIKFDDSFSEKLDSFLGNGSDDENNKLDINYALGLVEYGNENKPFEYESVFVINMLLEKYY